MEQSQPVPEDSPSPKKARRIAEVSPEGVPAQPDAGPKTIGLMLATVVIVLLAAAVLLAALLSPVAGIALGGLALVFFLANPAVWTAVLRADERDKV